ncbi:MAG: hypothetical protein L0G99_16600, partial [Propionibacteriales bacterium]|nr:hypothetical protein [Propionibacteriales bacterium]
IGGMGAEGWADQLRMSRTLTAQTPSMEAHGLAFCERTNADIVDVLRRRFDLSNDPYDLRPRLAVDLLAAAFHRALDRWVADAERPGPDSLANSLREACAAAPGSLTLLARPR